MNSGEAELVVEEVEKVANVVEKVSEEVAEKFPDDGELKKAALVVEHASKVVCGCSWCSTSTGVYTQGIYYITIYYY